MRHLIIKLFGLWALWLCVPQVHAQPVVSEISVEPPAVQESSPITVIVNPRSELGQLSRKQIVDIYMGRITVLPNNSIPLPIDYQGSPEMRAQFYQALTGKSLAQINAYWARLSFTGQANPPRKLANKAAMSQVVEKNRNALGYVDAHSVGSAVVPLMVIK